MVLRYVVANPHCSSASGPKRARACPRRPVVRCACRAREPGPWRPRNHRDRPAQSPGSVCTSSQTLTFHGPSLDNARSPGRKSAQKHRVQSSATFRRVEQACRKCILRPGSLEPPSRHGARRSRTLTSEQSPTSTRRHVRSTPTIGVETSVFVIPARGRERVRSFGKDLSDQFSSWWPRGSVARPRGSQTKAIAFDISAMSGVIAAVTIGTARSKLLNTVLSGSDDTALVARDLFFSQGAAAVCDLRACTLKK